MMTVVYMIIRRDDGETLTFLQDAPDPIPDIKHVKYPDARVAGAAFARYATGDFLSFSQRLICNLERVKSVINTGVAVEILLILPTLKRMSMWRDDTKNLQLWMDQAARRHFRTVNAASDVLYITGRINDKTAKIAEYYYDNTTVSTHPLTSFKDELKRRLPAHIGFKANDSDGEYFIMVNPAAIACLVDRKHGKFDIIFSIKRKLRINGQLERLVKYILLYNIPYI